MHDWFLKIFSIGIQNQGITHLISSFSDRSELSIELMNKLINQDNEYWYIGSMFAKSAMVKNKFVEWMAIGLYPKRARSIFFSVSSATAWNKKER